MNRRSFLKRGLILGAAAPLAGCKTLDNLVANGSPARAFMARANHLTQATQRAVIGRDALAPEFTRADIQQGQKPNGVISPPDADYQEMLASGFENWRLTVKGRVAQPLSLSLQDLMAMPRRTQITRHDCVEGWSCIAEWTGVPLTHVLNAAQMHSDARFVVIHCMDTIERTLSGGVKYYESIDLIDAFHPQTLLAYGLNGATLPERNGAPLRLRVERQLGYKMAKYITSIEAVPTLAGYGLGKGGYWEDRGYDWYAGI